MESNLNVHGEKASFSTLTLKKKILILKTFIHGKMFTKILNKKTLGTKLHKYDAKLQRA